MKIAKNAAMLLAVSGVLISSCKERIETEDAFTAWGKEIRAELTGVGDVQTRSHNVYMYEVRWDNGDQIYVKDANGRHAKFTLVDGENTTDGVFRQNSDEKASLTGAIEAFSPADLGETMVWPSVMTESAETPMYSTKETKSEGDESLKFKSLGSVVNLVFNSQTQDAALRSITLSADQPLSGAFTVDADGKAVLADGADGTVTLDLGADGKALTSPAAYSFYMYLPSGDYTNLTATFTAMGGNTSICNFGAKTLHHNAVEKFSVAGRFSASVVTGTAAHISCRNAEITGKANLPKVTSAGYSFGIMYSTSPDVAADAATRIEASSSDSEHNYSINTEVLEPETTYYYRAYVSQSGEMLYGEVKSFTTLAVSSMIQTLGVEDIKTKHAVMNGGLDLTDCRYDELEYGVEITPQGGEAHIVKAANLAGKKFSATDDSLLGSTEYSYRAYVRLDGRTYKGEANYFTTLPVHATISAESSDVTTRSVRVSGKLTIESEGDFEKSAIVYYSSSASTLDALKSGGKHTAVTLNPDGSFSVEVTSLLFYTTYNYVVVAKLDETEFASAVGHFTTKNLKEMPELVDLGLSVKWRSMNVFANRPEDFGGYFSWAATTGTGSYEWANTPYCEGLNPKMECQRWSKYVNDGDNHHWYKEDEQPDNKTVLEPSDDAANMRVGAGWRMPTFEEWQELMDSGNCSWIWVSYKGINGCLVQSKKAGFTDNWIFLPAAGEKDEEKCYDDGARGVYWTSSLFDNSDRAYNINFNSEGPRESNQNRYFGLLIRPVSNKK